MTFIVYYLLPFIIVLGILIFFHELGHFLVAKYFGVKVLKFSLGFGHKLVGKKIGETEYVISTVPLGGYVKLLGENDNDAEPVAPEEAHKAFGNQHVMKRIAIVGAGPLFNLFLSLVLFCAYGFVSGSYVPIPEIGQVRTGSPAEKAGLMKGGGIAAGQYKTVELGVWEAIKEGTFKTWEVTKLTCLTIVKLFQGVVSIKTLGGPIMIGQLTGQAAQESFGYLIPLLAVISVNLGVLNLLPVPILDGGVIIFLLVELIIGKPVSLRKRDVAQKAGLFLLA